MKLSLPALLRRSALAASLSLSALAADAAELVMVEQEGCMYCARWDAEIAPAYPKTEAGAYAPLVRRNIRDGAPEGSSYARKVVFTPTFILMEDGREAYGMQTFQQHLQDLVTTGMVEYEVAKSAAPSPSDFELAIQTLGGGEFGP